VTGAVTVAPLATADVLVTDAGMGRSARNALGPHVGDLLLAEVQEGGPQSVGLVRNSSGAASGRVTDEGAAADSSTV
jgi:hypothetical protein